MTRAESFQKLAAIDVETSGINPFRHQILSLALVPLDLSKPPLELYINEGEPEWQRIAANYFEESRSAWEAVGRSASEACTALSSYIKTVFGEQITVVGHNVGFDVAFLRQLAFRADLDQVPLISHRAIDTHTILHLLHLSGVIPEDALSSDGAFRYFDIRPQASARHTAIGDALATRELFIRALELWDGASAIMTVTANQENDMKSTAIRRRGVELDKMYQERFPDTDEVFDIADSEGYIISEQHHPEFFRHYTEVANLWTAQGYLPRCGPLTRRKLETVLQWDKMQPKKGQTVAEAAFESFCDRAPSYRCRRVKEGLGKTPDYIVTIGDQKIVAEVKEVGREINEGTVGDPARRMIQKANRQLKALTEERYPGITVLYDPFSLFHVSGPMGFDHIRAAMYGFHTLGISDSRDPAEPSRVVNEWTGKDQTTTPTKNTTTSAVCVLRLDSQLLVFHNCFAAIPIDPSIMAFEGVHQFRISDDRLKWLIIE